MTRYLVKLVKPTEHWLDWLYILFTLPELSSITSFTLSKTSPICWEFVTSIKNVFIFLLVTDFKDSAPSLVKQVASTFTPILSKQMAVSRPNPLSHPVIRTYFPSIASLCSLLLRKIHKTEAKTQKRTAAGTITSDMAVMNQLTSRLRPIHV